MLGNQLQFDDEIKYYDWDWNYGTLNLNTSSIFSASRKGPYIDKQVKVTN